MPTNRRILSQDAAAAAGQAQGLVLHLDANDEDSIESGGANTGSGSGTWFDIANHDLNVPLVDKASNLQLHLNASDTTSYSGSGNDWTDISQNSNTASDTSPTFSSDTRGYFVMDGSNDYFTINYDASLYMTSNTGFTIEAWVNRDDNDEGYIIASDDGSTFPFSLSWNSTTHGYYGWISGSGYDANAQVGLNNVTTNGIGEWDHVVMTQSSVDRKNRLYVNGTLTSTSSGASSGFHSTSSGVNVGAYHNETGKFDGKISVIRIYNVALTASEVAQNFRADCFLSYSSIYDTNLNANFDAANYTSSAWVDSVNSNSGTVNNASFDKELGNFFDFNRSDDNENITVSDSASLSPTSALSIEVIVRPETFANHQRIVWKNGSYGLYASANGLYTFFINSTSNQVQGTLNETGKFKHIVGTFDGSNMKIYINGILQATASLSASITDNSNAFTIGGDGTTARYYDGQIGFVRLFSSALTSAQVAQNYLATKNDYPNGTNATINGATFSATTPAFFELDGSNDFIDTNFSNNKMEEFTISTFVRFADATPSGNKYFISDTSNGNEFTATFHLGMTQTTGNWILFIGDGSSTQNASSNVVATGISDNTWTHIAFTCDGINDTVKYYKNGSLSSTIFDGTANLIGSHSGAGTMKLGRFGGLSSFFTDMDFGQFKIFNKTLSASEVLAEYNANKATYGL